MKQLVIHKIYLLSHAIFDFYNVERDIFTMRIAGRKKKKKTWQTLNNVFADYANLSELHIDVFHFWC